MFDGSQARARKDWWTYHSKKIRQGPGIRSHVAAMCKKLGV
jgi:hypothetical protein